MARKIHVTRTFAPLQFEALEPHRFEDLVRGLLHGYRDWQRIEATGRGGSDDGFDIRAYERTVIVERADTEDDEDREQAIVAEGNLWMIQCKREKRLSAARIVAIIDEAVRREAPPYGYVLAAPVNFTKRSYDAFRTALIDRGVTEFQLLGRAELEDMLYQPKNDQVLFTFFGISLTSRKRSRVTDIRATVSTKNKLFKILGGNGPSSGFSTDVLVRDTDDTCYPDEDAAPDFKIKPAWRAYVAHEHHVDGVCFHVGRHYAYFDAQKKTWDFIQQPNRARPSLDEEQDPEVRSKDQIARERAQDLWNHLPSWQRAEYVVDGLITYGRVDFVDREGDQKYPMPHLYVRFGTKGPFDGYWEFLEHNQSGYVSLEGMTRVEFFPKDLPEIRYGKIHTDKKIAMPSYLAHRVRAGQHAFFDFENAYEFLNERDVIEIPNPDDRSTSKVHAEVTFKHRATVAQLIELDPSLAFQMEQQIGRKPEPDEQTTVLQLKEVYDFQLERRR